MDYKKKYLKYKLKYLLAKKKLQGGKPNAPVNSREYKRMQHNKESEESGYFDNAIGYFKGVGESVGNTVKNTAPSVITGIPGIKTMYNFGTSIIRESDYEIVIDNLLNKKIPTDDEIKEAKLTINTIMFNEKDNKVMIEKLNKFITNFLINWNKNPNNKTHWYQPYLENDIKQKTDELDKLYTKFIEITDDNTAGLDLGVFGLKNPTKYGELMKSLEELDESKILDVVGDTVGEIFSDVFSGGKKNKK